MQSPQVAKDRVDEGISNDNPVGDRKPVPDRPIGPGPRHSLGRRSLEISSVVSPLPMRNPRYRLEGTKGRLPQIALDPSSARALFLHLSSLAACLIEGRRTVLVRLSSRPLASPNSEKALRAVNNSPTLPTRVPTSSKNPLKTRPSSSSRLKSGSITRMKRSGDRGQPCLTPCSTAMMVFLLGSMAGTTFTPVRSPATACLKKGGNFMLLRRA